MTALEQLDLFGSEEKRPVYGVTVCPWCGTPLAAVPIDDPTGSWQPAILFGYIEQKAHERERHPERAA